MIYLGEPITAQKALQFGLVNEVVPAAKVLDTAMEWARRLMKMPPLGVRCAKLLVHTGMNTDLKSGIEAERQAMASSSEPRIGSRGWERFSRSGRRALRGADRWMLRSGSAKVIFAEVSGVSAWKNRVKAGIGRKGGLSRSNRNDCVGGPRLRYHAVV